MEVERFDVWYVKASFQQVYHVHPQFDPEMNSDATCYQIYSLVF